MRRYGRDFPDLNRRGPARLRGRDYDIDYGYRRGGLMGSRSGAMRGPGHPGAGLGSPSGRSSGASGLGAGGPYTAYGQGEMGVTFGDRGRPGRNLGGMNRSGANRGGRGAYLRGPGARTGVRGSRGMRYDIGYGMGTDREWF